MLSRLPDKQFGTPPTPGSFESSKTSSPLYTPRSSLRPATPQDNMEMEMEVVDSTNAAAIFEFDSECVVNGKYNRWAPRLPLRRQTAMTHAPSYYESLAMFMPLQHVQIEHELKHALRAIPFNKQAFDQIVDRAYDDYQHRHMYPRTPPRCFYEATKNTIQYLADMGYISNEALKEGFACLGARAF